MAHSARVADARADIGAIHAYADAGAVHTCDHTQSLTRCTAVFYMPLCTHMHTLCTHAAGGVAHLE